jgi:hypothetical protein
MKFHLCASETMFQERTSRIYENAQVRRLIIELNVELCKKDICRAWGLQTMRNNPIGLGRTIPLSIHQKHLSL